ncbi:hypothetical protein WME94_50610 [Sorangium sp. So ce429]
MQARKAEPESTLLPMSTPAEPVLPFKAEPDRWAPPMVPAEVGGAHHREDEDEGTGTILAEVALARDTLPFTRPERAEPAQTILAALAVEEYPLGSFPGTRPAPRFEPEMLLPEEAPAPPPWIGPLASREQPETKTVPELDEAVPPAPQIATTTAGEAPKEAGATMSPEQVQLELSIERLSAISAEIAEGRSTRTDVLRRHELSERAWVANDRRWTEALREEKARGQSRLRAASDRAYIEAVEGFRGPITLSEYARIAVAIERGRADQVLDELKIQRPALMRIVRLWTKRIATDAKLAEETRLLLSQARSS